VIVTDGGDHRSCEGSILERLPGGGSPYSTAATYGRVRRYGNYLDSWTARKELPDDTRHSGRQILVLFVAVYLLTPAPGRPLVSIRKAFLFGFLQCALFHQNSLSLVPAPSPAEADDHGRKGAVLPGSSRERCVAAGQVDEVIEICASKAQRPSFFHAEESALPQFLATLGAFRFAENGENNQALSCRVEVSVGLLSFHALNVT
jgi:hypothetical protein